MAKKKTDNLERQADKAGYTLEREKAGTLVLWPHDGSTGTRFEDETQVRAYINAG